MPFIFFDEEVLELPIIHKEFDGFFDSTIGKLKFIIYTKLYSLLTKMTIWHFKRRGIPVVFFIMNTQETVDLGIELGCNSIMSDNPAILQKYLKMRNLE